MTALYLYINGLMYLVFGVWCSVKLTQTARAVGFMELSNGGHSEYLVVYGGMQLGLGLFFIYCAARAHHRLGLIFALLLYAPIVAYRITSVMLYRPVGGFTLGTGLLEAVFLFAGAALFFTQRSAV